MATWSIPVHKLAERTGISIAKVVRGAVLQIFNDVVMRSPVDTGRFRANWNVSYNSINTQTSAKIDKSGQVKLNEVKAAVLGFRIGDKIYLCNSLPYALPLEYGGYPNPPKFGSKKRGEDGMAIHVVGGYSRQAPNGMVRIAAREFQAAVEAKLKS